MQTEISKIKVVQKKIYFKKVQKNEMPIKENSQKMSLIQKFKCLKIAFRMTELTLFVKKFKRKYKVIIIVSCYYTQNCSTQVRALSISCKRYLNEQ